MITKREAAIITCYTMKLLGRMEWAKEYAEEIFKREVFTHEFGNPDFISYLKRKSKKDFLELNNSISEG